MSFFLKKSSTKQLVASILVIVLSLVTVAGTEFVLRQSHNSTIPENFIANTQDTKETTIEGQVLSASDGELSFSNTANYGTNGGVLVLNATQDPKISLNSYNNTGTATFKIYQISQADMLNALLYTKENDESWGASIKPLYTIDPSRLTEVAQFQQEVTKNEGSRYYTDISLPLSGTGTWFLTGELNGRTGSSMIVRTNTAGLVHRGDNESLFWIQDTEYRAVPNAQIQLFNLEGSLKTLATLNTDENGMAKISANDAFDLAIVSHNGEYTLIPIQYSNLSYRIGPENSYDSFSTRTTSERSFIFTDRFLYKPGDTVYFKSIIRTDDDANYTITPKTYQVEMQSSGDVIWQKSMTLSELGSIDGSIPISADQKADYLAIIIKDGERYISSTGVQVARFRKPDSTISAQSDKLMYLPKENITIEVRGAQFLGQPIANQPVRYKVYESESYATGGYQEIQFAQIIPGYSGGKNIITEGSLTFDQNGKASLTVPAENSSGYRKNWTFHFEYIDASGSSTNEALQVLVHPGDFVIEQDPNTQVHFVNTESGIDVSLKKNHEGAKLDNIQITASLYKNTDSGGENLVTSDIKATSDSQGQASLKFTASQTGGHTLKLDAQDQQGNPIKAEIYLSIREVGSTQLAPEQIFTITSDKKEYEVGETAKITVQTKPEIRHVFMSSGRTYSREHLVLPLQNGSASFELPIVEKYQPNTFIQASSFYGEELKQQYIPITVNTDDKEVTVRIEPSAQKYLPGETATFEITTVDGKGNPVSTDMAFWIFDKALLELHGVYFEGIFEQFWRTRWFSIPTKYSYQGLSGSGAEGGGGCFSGETLITMADGTQKRIDQVQKGEQVRTLLSADSTEQVSASVADAYAVQVPGYLILNGSTKITPEHILYVNDKWKTAGEIVQGDSLINSDGEKVTVRSIEWIKGDFTVYNLHVEKYHTFLANDLYVHNAKGDSRSTFKDLAYWNPHVQTDANGKARVTVELPDNLTTWVTAAVAANTKTQVGEGINEFIVTKDVVMRPIFPSFLRAGDSITLAGFLQNFSQAKETFSVTASFTGGTISDAEQSTLIDVKDTSYLYWPTTDLQVGESTFKISAKGTQNTSLIDEVTETLPIYPYAFDQTTYHLGKDTVLLTPTLSDGTDVSKATGTILLSVSEFPRFEQQLRDTIDKTNNFYPSDIEILVASALYNQYGSELGFEFSQQNVLSKAEEAQKSILASRVEGGYWDGYAKDIFASALPRVEALVIAQRAGMPIDEQALQETVSKLSNLSSQNVRQEVDKQYVLSLFPDMGFEKKQLGYSDQLGPEHTAKAVIVNARNGFVNSDTEEKMLLDSAKESSSQFVWVSPGQKQSWERIYIPTVWSTRALIELRSNPEKISKALTYLHRNVGARSYDRSDLGLATVEYYRLTNQFGPEYTYQVSLDGELLTSGSMQTSGQTSVSIPLSSAQLSSASQISVQKDGIGQLFSNLQIEEHFTTREREAQSTDLKLERKYLSTKAEGEPTEVGDLVNVQFTVSGLGVGERDIEILDYTPSGLVAIDESLDNGNFDENSNTDSYQAQEITDQGMMLRFDHLGSDTGVYSYKARVVSEGVFDAPPAMVTLRNQPSIWASSNADRLVIDGENVLETLKSRNDRSIVQQSQEVVKDKALLIILAVVVVTVGLLGGIYIKREAIKTWWRKRKNVVPPDETPPLV